MRDVHNRVSQHKTLLDWWLLMSAAVVRCISQPAPLSRNAQDNDTVTFNVQGRSGSRQTIRIVQHEVHRKSVFARGQLLLPLCVRMLHCLIIPTKCCTCLSSGYTVASYIIYSHSIRK